MSGSHLVISSVLTSAAVAGCIAYLLSPPIASVKVDRQSAPSNAASDAPEIPTSKAADRSVVENEKAAIAYLEAAQAILRLAPIAYASASADKLPIKGRIPLPRKRPIPRP